MTKIFERFIASYCFTLLYILLIAAKTLQMMYLASDGTMFQSGFLNLYRTTGAFVWSIGSLVIQIVFVFIFYYALTVIFRIHFHTSLLDEYELPLHRKKQPKAAFNYLLSKTPVLAAHFFLIISWFKMFGNDPLLYWSYNLGDVFVLLAYSIETGWNCRCVYECYI